jgi:DNA (cytosine-5)-methyltransferase 1
MGRDDKVMIRVTDEEGGVFRAAAGAHGLSTASWARMQLLGAARLNGSTLERAARTSDLELLSLFCGPGGLDEGFNQAGFFTRLALDSDRECVNTFNFNHSLSRAEVQDIRGLKVDRLDELAGPNFRPIGVLGGPPCQSFSVSNVHQNDSDPRHTLPVEYARLLRELNERHPISFFLFENVPGLLGARHLHRYEAFKKDFAAADFEIHEEKLDAINYGVPQVRPRIFIVGINKKLHPDAQWSTPPPEARPPRTVRQVIGLLPDPAKNEPGSNPDAFPVHPNHWILLPKSKKFSSREMLKEGQMFGRSFRTLKWDEPSWTVAYGHREVHVHPSGKRRLSIYEAMRFQTFPHKYRLTGNISAQVRMVSEAVPVRLAWHLAVHIRRALGI